MPHRLLDGSEIEANASKHKAMSYERMESKIARLEREIDEVSEEEDGTWRTMREKLNTEQG